MTKSRRELKYRRPIMSSPGESCLPMPKGRPYLSVKEICEKVARKRPENVRDVLAVVKLEMIKRCEFVKEVRDGSAV